MRLNRLFDTTTEDFEAYVDGQLVPDVYLADEEGGYVRCFVRDAAGNLQIMRTATQLDVATHTQRGKVEIRRRIR